MHGARAAYYAIFQVNVFCHCTIMLTMKVTRLLYVTVLMTVWILALVAIAVDLEDIKRKTGVDQAGVDKTGKEQQSCVTM